MTDVTPPPVAGATWLVYRTIEGRTFINIRCPGCQAFAFCGPAGLAEAVEAFAHTSDACPVLRAIQAARLGFALGEAPRV